MARGRRISKRQESTSSMSWVLLSCAIFLICILLLYAVNSLGTKTLLYQNHNTDSEKNAIQLPKRPEQLISSIYGAIANKSNNSLAVNDSQARNASELANIPLQEQSEIQNISNNSNISQENKENINKPQKNDSKENINRPWETQENKENINKPQENESKENIDRPWKTQENVDKSQENNSKENIDKSQENKENVDKSQENKENVDKSQENESKENIDKPQESESKENIDRPWKNKENESKDKDDVVRPWKRKNNDSKKEIIEYKRIKKDKEEKEQQTKGKGKENKEKEQTNKKKDVKEQDKKEKEEPKKDAKDKKDDKRKPMEEHLGMLYLKTTPGNWVKEAVKEDRVLLSLLEKSTQFRIGIHLYDTNYIRRLALENSEVVSVDNPSQMFEKVFKPQIEESFTQVRFHDSKAEYSGIGKVKKREGTGISKDKKLRMKYYALLVQMKFKTQYYYCVFGMPFSEYKRNPRAIETILRTMYFKEK